MKAKAVYEFLPIYGRHIFYSNDLGALRKLVVSYFKPTEISYKSLDEILIDNKLSQGVTIVLNNIDDENHARCFCLYAQKGADINVVVHEAHHLSNYLSVYMGMQLDGINDEPQAYLEGYLVEQYLKHINGYKPKAKPRVRLK